MQIKIMKNIIIQGTITIMLFFGTWYALTQIDWIKMFQIQKVTDKTEEKLGELFWEVFKKTEDENKNIHLETSVDSLVTHICQANDI